MVMVRTANNDKYVTTADHLVLRLGMEAVVSVCYDRRWSVLPSWLDDGTWTYTGGQVEVTDAPASPLEVFEKTFAAGELTLGGNRSGGAAGAKSNYIVIVRPAASSSDVTALKFTEGPIAPDEWLNDGDSDGDGLTDGFEVDQGLDPANPDTDLDGIVDEAETDVLGRDLWDVQEGLVDADPDDGTGGGSGGGGCFIGTSGFLAATLSVEAQSDEQVKDLPQDKWRRPGALNEAKSGGSVQVQTLDASDGDVELVYAMPNAKAVTKKVKLPLAAGGSGELEEFTALFLGNAPVTGAPGEPILPVVPCYVVLPEGQTYAGATVTAGNVVGLPGTYRVRHAQPAIPLLPDAKPRYVKPDPAIYGSDDPFPANTLGTVRVQKKRGVTIVVVNLNPVVYRPKSGAVSYYTSLKLSIQTKPEEPATGAKHRIRYRPDRSRPLAQQVDNPGALESYEKASAKGGGK
jgi:hypothetical protein